MKRSFEVLGAKLLREVEHLRSSIADIIPIENSTEISWHLLLSAIIDNSLFTFPALSPEKLTNGNYTIKKKILYRYLYNCLYKW